MKDWVETCLERVYGDDEALRVEPEYIIFEGGRLHHRQVMYNELFKKFFECHDKPSPKCIDCKQKQH